MNKLYALFIVTIIIGCDSSRNLSIESLIENKDLDELPTALIVLEDQSH